MNPDNSFTSRRNFLKTSGQVAAASAIAAAAVPHVFAAENNTVQLALVGAGGRGSGAADQALSTSQIGPVKLVAMADVFPAKLSRSYESLQRKHKDRVDVPEERRFLGFDANRKAMDCLKPGDVVILTTPCAFRWPMFEYAIQKGLHVFMEKPITTDGPAARKMLALAEKAKEKNLKVGVGLMCRHCTAREDLYKRIKDGQIGDLLAIRYRMGPGGGTCGPKPASMTHTLYQVQKFHSFMWSGGGVFMDYLIHNIDECCWMKDAWPVSAQATGGRHYRGRAVDQNFDNYSIEYTFPDGTKLMVYARTMAGCFNEFASFAHGTKGSAVISTSSHTPAKCRIYKGQSIIKDNLVWAFPQPEPNPYQLEWDHLMTAIRNDTPYNEVKRGTEASLVTAMGRMAAHTGQIITFDQMLNCPHEFAPEVATLTADSAPPLPPLADGTYPVPQPGIVTKREY